MGNKVNFAAAFHSQPIRAKLKETGQEVRLLATGDIDGMSPGYLFVDESGNSLWAPFSQFEIVDESVLPVGGRSGQLAGRR